MTKTNYLFLQKNLKQMSTEKDNWEKLARSLQGQIEMANAQQGSLQQEMKSLQIEQLLQLISWPSRSGYKTSCQQDQSTNSCTTYAATES